jgi:DNA-binding MarR family transcriptional regulator
MSTREPQIQSEVATHLLELLPVFMLDLRHEMSRNRYSSLTMAQFRVLSQLRWGGPANNKCIAENLGVTVANSSRMIDLLVKKKLVVRAQSVKDKREVLVRLSPKGLAHFQEVQERLCSFVAERFGSASRDELATMESGLSLLRSSMRSERPLGAHL